MSDEQKNNDWKERELGALWVKKSLNGTQYMTGHIELRDASGKVQLVVFKNKHKLNEDGTVANEKAPDFRVYKSEEREQRQGSGGEPLAKQPLQRLLRTKIHCFKCLSSPYIYHLTV